MLSRLLLALFLIPLTAGSVTHDPYSEIAQDPNRSGGVYYAYPYSDDVVPEVPDGYEPVHLSHYGRHGSRWLIKTWEYDETTAALDSAHAVGGLTPLGEDVRQRLHIIADQAAGNGGALTPLGELQHKAIATRMARRFPSLFAPGSHVESHSSIEPRCIMSMAAFSEALREIYPTLQIKRFASPGDMNFINYKSPEVREIGSSDAPWWRSLAAWRDSVVNPERLMSTLFTDPGGIPDPVRLMVMIHDVAVDTQDALPGVELLEIFTTPELYNLWSVNNYKMYYQNGNNPLTRCAGAAAAHSLLHHIVNDLNNALTDPGAPAVFLRFGHDTALLKLLSLMGVQGASASVEHPRDYANAWQDYNLSPMAANLQFILFTSARESAPPLVLLRLNERPVLLEGIEPLHGWYYPLDVLQTRLNQPVTTDRTVD